MKKLFTIIILLASLQASAQIGVYNGKPVYNILAIRTGDTIGNIVVEMYPKVAPLHVRNFDSLVAEQFYNHSAFHRVIPGFVIQGGDPNSKNGPRSTWGFGQPWQVEIPAEFNPISHQRGVFSAARSTDPNSATSQFFICVAAATSLDNNYTAYGKVTSGMDFVDNIVASPRDASDNPFDKIEMFVTRIDDDTTAAIAANIIQPADKAIGVSANYTFKWDAVPGALIYELEISRDPNFITVDTLIKTAKTSALVPSLLPGEILYYWRLWTNNGGYRTATLERTFTTGTFPPSLIFPGQNASLPTNTIDFSWDTVASVTSYKIQVATNPNFTIASIQLEEDSISSTMFYAELQPNKKHFWRVASEINGIPGGYSAARTFTTGAAVGINANKKENISVYPNPASGNWIVLKGIDSKEIQFSLYDILGNKMLTGTTINQGIDVSTLSAGMYVLKTEFGIVKLAKE